MTRAALLREVGPVEFLEWQVKMVMDEADARRREWTERTRADYGFATVAREIYFLTRRVDGLLSKSEMPADVKPEEFMTEFKITEAPAPARAVAAGDKPAAREENRPADRPPGVTDEEYRAFRERRARVWLSQLVGDPAVLEG